MLPWLPSSQRHPLLPLLLLLLLAPESSGFIPLSCARRLQRQQLRRGGRRPPTAAAPTVGPVRCCPGNCGGSTRGECRPVAPTSPPRERDFLGLPGDSPLLLDDRLDWPAAFFSHLCRCRGRRFGAACETCAFGWRGPGCQQRDARVRRNVEDLSADERRKLRDLMLLARRVVASEVALLVETVASANASDPLRRPRFLTGASLHYYLVHLHFYAQRGTLAVPADQCKGPGVHFNFNHQGNNFLPWHRYFLLVWERALQTLAASPAVNWPDFAMPYWNWTGAGANCSVCTADLFGMRSPDSPFRRWEELCSPPRLFRERHSPCFGCQAGDSSGGGRPRRRLRRRWLLPAGQFPTRAEVQFVAERPAYYLRNDLACDSLLMALEGECGPGGLTPMFFMHNRLHALVDGSFKDGATSPNDPLFPLHHAQVDRILESWLSKFGHSRAVLQLPDMDKSRPGHGPESYLVGFVPLVRAIDILVPTEALGYSYDTLRL